MLTHVLRNHPFAASAVVLLTACAGTPTGTTADSGTGAAAHEVLCLSAGTTCSGATPVCCATSMTTSTCGDASGGDSGTGVGTCSSHFSGFAAPSCVASAADCTGQLVLGCDGAEDCAAGQACCATASTLNASCQASCPTMRTGVLAQVCHDHTQCPTDYPACCVITTTTGPSVSFGLCATIAAESSVDFPAHCDMP